MSKTKYRKIVKEWNEATTREIWEGVRDNFIFGFLGAILVVFISTRTDIAVLLGYLVYYCLLYTSPSPRDRQKSRMPSSA